MSDQVEIRLTATGSTDAVDKAKRMAREQGYRIQTVASVRLARDVTPPADPARQEGSWCVTLAVRSAA